MNLFIISASQRHPSQSLKVARYVGHMIEKSRKFQSYEIYDLGSHPLPLWDEGVWRNDPKWEKILSPLRQKVINADAFVMVIPEWNGGVTPAIKNFSLFFDEKETGHKPVWLITISSEINGQYPIADMKAFGSKNNKWIFIPDHTIIRFVKQMLNNHMPHNQEEKILIERMAYSLHQLALYAQALKSVRLKFTFDERFKYAM